MIQSCNVSCVTPDPKSDFLWMYFIQNTLDFISVHVLHIFRAACIAGAVRHQLRQKKRKENLNQKPCPMIPFNFGMSSVLLARTTDWKCILVTRDTAPMCIFPCYLFVLKWNKHAGGLRLDPTINAIQKDKKKKKKKKKRSWPMEEYGQGKKRKRTRKKKEGLQIATTS